jgi:hypothetical protein
MSQENLHVLSPQPLRIWRSCKKWCATRYLSLMQTSLLIQEPKWEVFTG